MKFICCISLIVVCFYAGGCEATSPQVCGYTALDGHFVFLRYFPIGGGEEFIDYGNGGDGVCLQRAVCLGTYETLVESCNDFNSDCRNRDTNDSEFPACCAKC